MPSGGLMALLAVGSQDQYLSASPEISYFKQVIKRFTNFSMESVNQVFLNKPVIDNSSIQTYTCRIGRYGDLLGQIYLCFTLPEIYSDAKTNVYDTSSEDLRFRWIKNIANHMIVSYSVTIDNQKIDERWGEWMDIWNEISMPGDKKFGYDRMSGNTEANISPVKLLPRVIIENNTLTYNVYPNAAPNSPSIPKNTYYVPLDFWFTKNPAVALPLVALQYQNVDITIQFRHIEELYQIWDGPSGKYISPAKYRSLGRTADVSISRFLSYTANANKTGTPSITGIDINASLECNYYYLDASERNYIAAANTDYIIERLYRHQYYGLLQGPNTLDLVLSNPIKEIIWILRRSDISDYNDWYNFTANVPSDPRCPTLHSARLLWNGVERIEEKSAMYFNLLQPFMYHTSSPRDGIYVWSSSLFPEKIQPSGAFNASTIAKINLILTTNAYPTFPNYDCVVFCTYYNIFRIMGGSGGMVFAS